MNPLIVTVSAVTNEPSGPEAISTIASATRPPPVFGLIAELGPSRFKLLSTVKSSAYVPSIT